MALVIHGAQLVYHDTKANLAAMVGLAADSKGYATDTKESGWFDGTNWHWVSEAGGAAAFTDLTDTFASYLGLGGEYVKVKATEDGLETDIPAGGGDVIGNGPITDGHLAIFDTDEHHIKDGGAVPVGGGDVYGDAGATDEHLAVFDADGYHIKDGGVVPAGDSVDGWIPASGTWTPRSQAYTNDPAAGSNIELEMVDTSGFYVNDIVNVSSGAGNEDAIITVVHANVHLTVATLTLNHDITNPLVRLSSRLPYSNAYTNDPGSGAGIELNMADTSGFAVGMLVEVSSGAGVEKATITVVHAGVHITVNNLTLDHTTVNPLVRIMTNNTFVVDTSVDLSTLIGMGDKIKFTDGTVKYFIVMAIVTTRITLFGGTDYSIAGASAVTSPSYSHVKSPFGFPLDPRKWSINITWGGIWTLATPAASTWYNTGSPLVIFPIGAWNILYKSSLRANDTGTLLTLILTSLSTANNSESDSEFTTQGYISPGASGGNTRVELPHIVQKYLTLVSKTIYYPIYQVGIANIDTVGFAQTSSPMRITATCAYL